MIKSFAVLVTVFGLSACASSSQKPAPTQESAVVATSTVVATKDIQWAPLNPLRGDKGPKAGKLWGDRTSTGASGFLVKFVDGFSSPPHIHNVTYRAFVIRGLVHNDDPTMEKMWMSKGSYWTQPKGDVHITSAKGADNLIYVEIQEGPYLVRPVDQAFEDEDKPRNVHASKVAWTPYGDGMMLAVLWGDPTETALSGTFVKMPAGTAASLVAPASELRAVVVEGRVRVGQGSAVLEPGNYVGASAGVSQPIVCEAGGDCIVYLRSGELKPTTGGD